MDEKLYEIKGYNKNSIVFLENAKAMPYFFIVKKGKLESLMRLHDKIQKYYYNEGDTFGLISCLTGHEYIERVTTLSDCSLIIVKKEKLIKFLMNKKDIFYKIVSNYSRRLSDIDKIIVKVCADGICFHNVSRLIEIADYFKFKENKSFESYALKKYVELTKAEEMKIKIEKRLIDFKETYQCPKVSNSKLSVSKGDIIFLEQEMAENFFYIESGRVKISHIFKSRELIIAVIKENEFFGEMAILNRVARNASAIALEDCELLVLNKNNFIDKLGNVILKNIFMSLAMRIWFTYRKLLNLSYKDPVARLYDYLDLLIASKEGRANSRSYFFDVSLNDLKKMTDTIHVDDFQIDDFLKDKNISYSYGSITIIDKEEFYSKVGMYVSREKIYLNSKK